MNHGFGRRELGEEHLAPARGAVRGAGISLFLLVTLGVISQVDRQILGILLDPIKQEIHATDSEMGLLSGFYYVILYTLAGIPIARIADSRSPKAIVMVCVALWSMATVLSGFAGSFAALAIARLALAAGEGGFPPVAYSLISDLSSPQRRSRAIAFMAAATAVGSGVSIMAGGALVETFGWRAVFVITGIPGLLMLPFILMFLKEPPRDKAHAAAPQLSFFKAMGQLWQSPTFRYMGLVAFGGGITGFGALGWMPAFLSRVHGLPQHEVGLKLGVTTIIAMLAGNLTVGYVGDWLSRFDIRWRTWMSALGLLVALPSGLLCIFAPGANLSIVAYGVFAYFLAYWPPAATTCIVTTAAPHSKALAAACFTFFLALGGAVGPYMIGVISDTLSGQYGHTALRYALGAAMMGCLLGGLAALAAGGKFRDECKRMDLAQA